LSESSEALFESERSRAFGEHSDQYDTVLFPFQSTHASWNRRGRIGSTIHARDAPVP
jgi:hypothetical protein